MHSLAFFDASDCSGTALTESTIGEGFTTDASGKGGFRGEFDTISLTGDNSIVGKYLQLSGSSSGEQSCCLVELSEKKGKKGKKGGKKGKKGGRGKKGGKGKKDRKDKKGRGLESVADLLQF